MLDRLSSVSTPAQSLCARAGKGQQCFDGENALLFPNRWGVAGWKKWGKTEDPRFMAPVSNGSLLVLVRGSKWGMAVETWKVCTVSVSVSRRQMHVAHVSRNVQADVCLTMDQLGAFAQRPARARNTVGLRVGLQDDPTCSRSYSGAPI
jgi:hypothetical protein